MPHGVAQYMLNDVLCNTGHAQIGTSLVCASCVCCNRRVHNNGAPKQKSVVSATETITENRWR